MEAEEKKDILPTGILTFLFIYFYVILRSIWDYGVMLYDWGDDYFIINSPVEVWSTLILQTIGWCYALISIVYALLRDKGAIKALRWSVFFILGLSALDLLSMLPDIKGLLVSIFKMFRLLFLVVFYIYLWRSKSIRNTFPKSERKTNWIVWTGWLIFIGGVVGCGFLGYKQHEETKYDEYFDGSLAGKLKGDSLYLDAGIIVIPKDWNVDSIAERQNLKFASIRRSNGWIIATSDIADKKGLEHHNLESRRLVPCSDTDILMVENAVPEGNGFITRGTIRFDGDTLDWRMATVYDSQSDRYVSMSMLSDSIDAEKTIHSFIKGITF